MSRYNVKQHGFTLLELVTVLVVVSLLISTTMSFNEIRLTSATTQKLEASVADLQRNLDVWIMNACNQNHWVQPTLNQVNTALGQTKNQNNAFNGSELSFSIDFFPPYRYRVYADFGDAEQAALMLDTTTATAIDGTKIVWVKTPPRDGGKLYSDYSFRTLFERKCY